MIKKSISDIRDEFNGLEPEYKIATLEAALTQMQIHNGRSRITCIAIALGYDTDEGETYYRGSPDAPAPYNLTPEQRTQVGLDEMGLHEEEGWGLFLNNDTNVMEVQRIDEADIFEDDTQALRAAILKGLRFKNPNNIFELTGYSPAA